MNNTKLKIRFIQFSFVWFFLINPLIDFLQSGINSAVVLSNYAIYLSYSVWVLNHFLRISKGKGKYLGTIVSSGTLKVAFVYMVFSAFLMVVHPDTSDLQSFTRNYGAVLPGIGMAVLLAYYATKRPDYTLPAVRFLYWMMVIISVISVLLVGTQSGRDGGIYEQANNYGFLLSLMLIMSAANISGHINLYKSKALSLILFLIALGFVLRTGSFGGLIVGILCSGYLMGDTLRKLTVTKVLGFGYFIVVLSAGFWFYINNIDNNRTKAMRELFTRGSQEEIEDASTFEYRSNLILSGVAQIESSWLFGNGYNGRIVKAQQREAPVHNAFIVEALKGGVPLGALMLWFYYYLFKTAKRVHNKKLRQLALVLWTYMFLSDNTLTYFSFFSMNSSVISLGLLIIVQQVDSVQSQRKLVPAQTPEFNQLF